MQTAAEKIWNTVLYSRVVEYWYLLVDRFEYFFNIYILFLGRFEYFMAEVLAGRTILRRTDFGCCHPVVELGSANIETMRVCKMCDLQFSWCNLTSDGTSGSGVVFAPDDEALDANAGLEANESMNFLDYGDYPSDIESSSDSEETDVD